MHVNLAVRDNLDFYEGVTSAGVDVQFEAMISRPAASTAITSQPLSQTTVLGGSALFSVNATGAPPLGYQWLFGTNTIAEATNSVLDLANVQYAEAGNYSVLVSGPSGSVTSSNALLTVLAPTAPAITAQPGNQTLAVGASATLSVVATGSPPISYQWYVGASGDASSPVAGATNAVFTTAQLYSSVAFWVEAQNGFGTAKSVSALVTVVAESSVHLGVALSAGFPYLTIFGNVGTTCHLEYKTDLRATNWSPLLDMQLSSSSYGFTDAGFTNSTRFYRVRSAL
jgi:hypothetical protein